MSARETGEVAVSPDGASADLSFALSTRPSWEAAAPAPKMAEAPRPYYAAAPPPLRPSSPVPSPPPPAAPVYQEEPTKYDLAGNPIASATSPPAAPKGMSQYLTGLLATKGNIEIRLSVVAVHGDRHLEAITVEDAAAHTQERIETESLFVFIGADARTEWLPCRIARDDRNSLLTGLEAQSSGKWILDRDPYLLETSVPGVFAAGDVRHGSIKRVASGAGSMAIAFVHQFLALSGATSRDSRNLAGSQDAAETNAFQPECASYRVRLL